METSKQQSAKILAFPIERLRANVERQMQATANKMDSASTHNLVDFGSCWYHDDAILHAQPITKK